MTADEPVRPVPPRVWWSPSTDRLLMIAGGPPLVQTWPDSVPPDAVELRPVQSELSDAEADRIVGEVDWYMPDTEPEDRREVVRHFAALLRPAPAAEEDFRFRLGAAMHCATKLADDELVALAGRYADAWMDATEPDAPDLEARHQANLRDGYVPNGAIVPLSTFVRWLSRLDEPHLQGARRVTNLNDIIARSKRAIAQSDAVRARAAAPADPLLVDPDAAPSHGIDVEKLADLIHDGGCDCGDRVAHETATDHRFVGPTLESYLECAARPAPVDPSVGDRVKAALTNLVGQINNCTGDCPDGIDDALEQAEKACGLPFGFDTPPASVPAPSETPDRD